MIFRVMLFIIFHRSTGWIYLNFEFFTLAIINSFPQIVLLYNRSTESIWILYACYQEVLSTNGPSSQCRYPTLSGSFFRSDFSLRPDHWRSNVTSRSTWRTSSEPLVSVEPSLPCPESSKRWETFERRLLRKFCVNISQYGRRWIFDIHHKTRWKGVGVDVN